MITASEMRPGLAVAANFDSDAVPEFERTTADGVVHEFRFGHPGVVIDCSTADHVLVAWLGLEDAGMSTAIGFGPDADGVYRGLLHRGDLTER